MEFVHHHHACPTILLCVTLEMRQDRQGITHTPPTHTHVVQVKPSYGIVQHNEDGVQIARIERPDTHPRQPSQRSDRRREALNPTKRKECWPVSSSALHRSTNSQPDLHANTYLSLKGKGRQKKKSSTYKEG